jgi:DNA (cytosine-5)-methyltransferase 1
VLLENVDRLLKSPASQRGRDFAIMLATMHLDGYDVQWRVIDASEYGFPQRRKRVFILAEKRADEEAAHPEEARSRDALRGHPRSCVAGRSNSRTSAASRSSCAPDGPSGRGADLGAVRPQVSRSPFGNVGVMRGGVVFTARATASYRKRPSDRRRSEASSSGPTRSQTSTSSRGPLQGLGRSEGSEADRARVSRRFGADHLYTYSEGAITYPDDPDRPSRTILTGEGGVTPSRFKHVVETWRG